MPCADKPLAMERRRPAVRLSGFGAILPSFRDGV
jgi:hypothetical protein